MRLDDIRWHQTSDNITWHQTTSVDIMWHHVISDDIRNQRTQDNIKRYKMTSHDIRWHRSTSDNIIWNQTTQDNIKRHHMTSHDIRTTDYILTAMFAFIQLALWIEDSLRNKVSGWFDYIILYIKSVKSLRQPQIKIAEWPWTSAYR